MPINHLHRSRSGSQTALQALDLHHSTNRRSLRRSRVGTISEQMAALPYAPAPAPPHVHTRRRTMSTTMSSIPESSSGDFAASISRHQQHQHQARRQSSIGTSFTVPSGAFITRSSSGVSRLTTGVIGSAVGMQRPTAGQSTLVSQSSSNASEQHHGGWLPFANRKKDDHSRQRRDHRRELQELMSKARDDERRDDTDDSMHVDIIDRFLQLQRAEAHSDAEAHSESGMIDREAPSGGGGGLVVVPASHFKQSALRRGVRRLMGIVSVNAECVFLSVVVTHQTFASASIPRSIEQHRCASGIDASIRQCAFALLATLETGVFGDFALLSAFRRYRIQVERWSVFFKYIGKENKHSQNTVPTCYLSSRKSLHPDSSSTALGAMKCGRSFDLPAWWTRRADCASAYGAPTMKRMPTTIITPIGSSRSRARYARWWWKCARGDAGRRRFRIRRRSCVNRSSAPT